eukprot:s3250_g17.t1
MIDLKRLSKRTRWNDVRRGIFRPEPNYDPEEFWLEVRHLSEVICDACSAAVDNPNIWNTNTECYKSCLNCSANWNRMSSYENHEPFFNEHGDDANVAARLVNVYNTSWDWRDVTATQDLKAFMVTAAMSMVGGYQTSGDVLKQVSHRGAIRLPVKMIKGKCKRNLLGQFAVQRESIVDLDERNVSSTRWFYRLTWDGGNVAYHDYVKTVLSTDEFYNIFGSHPSAEYVGDIMEFWLGMFELAIQCTSNRRMPRARKSTDGHIIELDQDQLGEWIQVTTFEIGKDDKVITWSQGQVAQDLIPTEEEMDQAYTNDH